MTTLTVKGDGGSIFDMDVPEEGTVRREVFDQAIAKGRLQVLSGDWPPESDDEPDGPPDPGAKVAVWRDYALSVDPDNAEAIAKMSKPALIERYVSDDDDESVAGEDPAGPDDGPAEDPDAA